MQRKRGQSLSRCIALLAPFFLSVSVTVKADLGGGTTPDITPPSNIIGGPVENFRRVFVESSSIVISKPLYVDHLGGLTWPTVLYEMVTPSSATPGVIPPGSTVNVLYFYIDPVEPFPILEPDDWTVFFESAISGVSGPTIGLIFESTTLDASDFLGAPNTIYPSGDPSRGIEVGDEIELILDFPSFGDHPAVITVIPALDGSDVLDGIRIVEVLLDPPDLVSARKLPTLVTGAALILSLALIVIGITRPSR